MFHNFLTLSTIYRQFTDDCLSPHPISAKGTPPSCPQILCIMHYSFAC